MNQIAVAHSRIEQLENMMNEMNELGRMRSDFALIHFVVGQHDTPGKQRAQAVMELQAMYFALADVYDDMQTAQLDLTDMDIRETTVKADARSRIERRKLLRKIQSMEMHITQRVKEIDCLLDLLDKLPKYTAKELEEEEPVYWAARLTRQAFLAGRDPGGNLDALLQFATVPGELKPITPVSPEGYLKSLGLEIEKIAAGLQYAGILTEEGAKLMIETEKKASLPPPKPVHNHKIRNRGK